MDFWERLLNRWGGQLGGHHGSKHRGYEKGEHGRGHGGDNGRWGYENRGEPDYKQSTGPWSVQSQDGRPCPQCRSYNPPDARFCNQCGTPLATGKCRFCGADLAPGTKFCGQCGQQQ